MAQNKSKTPKHELFKHEEISTQETEVSKDVSENGIESSSLVSPTIKTLFYHGSEKDFITVGGPW